VKFNRNDYYFFTQIKNQKRKSIAVNIDLDGIKVPYRGFGQLVNWQEEYNRHWIGYSCSIPASFARRFIDSISPDTNFVNSDEVMLIGSAPIILNSCCKSLLANTNSTHQTILSSNNFHWQPLLSNPIKPIKIV